VAEILQDVAIKLFGVVDYYLPGYSEMADYVLPEKSFEPCCCYVD
jgi:hypothetical protein